MRASRSTMIKITIPPSLPLMQSQYHHQHQYCNHHHPRWHHHHHHLKNTTLFYSIVQMEAGEFCRWQRDCALGSLDHTQ